MTLPDSEASRCRQVRALLVQALELKEVAANDAVLLTLNATTAARLPIAVSADSALPPRRSERRLKFFA